MGQPAFTTEKFMRPCGCREAGCLCNALAETHAANAMIDSFADMLKTKFAKSRILKGRTGWDEKDWSAMCGNLMRAHCYKGDPVDVALFAAFLWNMSDEARVFLPAKDSDND